MTTVLSTRATVLEQKPPPSVLPSYTWDDPATELGPRLAWLRRQRGLSQAQVAAAVGTSASQLCKIETGALSPTVELLQRLLAQLDCSPRRLLSMPPGKVSHSWRAIDRAVPAAQRQPMARELSRKAMQPEVLRLQEGEGLVLEPRVEFFLLVIKGQLQWLIAGEEPQHLAQGDNLYCTAGSESSIRAEPGGVELLLVRHC